MNQERQQPVEQKIDNGYKKIVVIGGRSGNGKSSLTDHLGGKFRDPIQSPSVASCATIYISDQCQLNIIDAQSLESCKTEQDLMNEIRKKNTCFVDSTIHAIIIMWSPLKDGHSVLLKTTTALQNSFEGVINSCVFMSQDNSENLAKIHQVDDSKKAAIEEEINKIKEHFLNVPVETYDTIQDAKVLSEQLKELMKRIVPYHVDERQEIQPEERAQADELRLPRLEEEKKEVEVAQPMVQEENRAVQEEENRVVQEENRAVQEGENRAIHEEGSRIVQEQNTVIQAGNRAPAKSIIGPAAKFGLLLAISGAATGMTAIAYDQSIALAAGTIGFTAGAVSLTVAAAAGTFRGLSWSFQRARGIRA